MKEFYFDYAASAPLGKEARAAMVSWLETDTGNPSSLHAAGLRAKQAIDESREKFAEHLGCEFGEVIFTSSGTEAANFALIGAALANENQTRNRILISASEHHCVLHCRPILERLGYEVVAVPVDKEGRIELTALSKELATGEVLLTAVMHANNELGTFQPVQRVAELCQQHGSLFFCDAVQTFAKLGSADQIGADLISFSAHKFGGPKGVGGLYVRAGTKLKPILAGGGQERELRAGTENVTAIVGAGTALNEWKKNAELDLAAEFLSHLATDHVQTVSDRSDCLTTIAHVRFPGITAETVLIRLDGAGVRASSGAACSSGSVEPSHVLAAIGLSEEQALEGVRFSFGPRLTVEDVHQGAELVSKSIEQIRARQPSSSR